MSCGSKSCGCKSGNNKPEINGRRVLNTTKINKIIGVLSGKGGVGKSMISSLLAVSLAQKGYKVGILDGDISGPSIGKIFGFDNCELYGDQNGAWPLLSKKYHIKLVSVNMLLEDDENPLVWRGPLVSNMVKQFYYEIYWEELDFLIIDMPPGTSDVSIEIIQEIPIDEIVMVSNPSKLVSMIVAKTINMANMNGIKITGLVDNMSYFKCDNCASKHQLDYENISQQLSEKYQLEVLASIPLDPKLRYLNDNGLIEDYQGDYLENLITKIS